MSRVLSVNIGRPMLQRVPEGRPTGIDKRPVGVLRVSDPGPRRILDGSGVSGVEGDHVGDGRFHGGSDRAVYAYAREELDLWAGALGRELPDGHFGENLTTTGLDVDAAEVGDRWRVGSTVLEVRWTRQPCATFGEWMGEPGWVKRFMAHGRTGALLSVVEPGEIRAGDPVVVERGGSGNRPADGAARKDGRCRPRPAGPRCQGLHRAPSPAVPRRCRARPLSGHRDAPVL